MKEAFYKLVNNIDINKNILDKILKDGVCLTTGIVYRYNFGAIEKFISMEKVNDDGLIKLKFDRAAFCCSDIAKEFCSIALDSLEKTREEMNKKLQEETKNVEEIYSFIKEYSQKTK